MFTIRPATDVDIPPILAIYNEAVLHTVATYDYEPRPLAVQKTWYEEHGRDGYPIFVAEDPGGSVVGWSSLSRYHPRIGYRYTVENSIYVAYSHQRQGIGKQLLSALMSAAEGMNVHVILASIDGDNLASIQLHAHFGFETVGRFKQVGYKFNRWLDVVYMQKIFPENLPNP